MDKNNEDDKNAYEVVGVGSDATEADIKRAFRQRSLKTHPDRVRRHRLVFVRLPLHPFLLRIPTSKTQVRVNLSQSINPTLDLIIRSHRI